MERWLDARMQRERMALVAAFVFVVAAIGYLGWIEPALARRASALMQVSGQQQLLAAAQARQAEALRTLSTDPDVAARAHADGLRRELQGMGEGALLAPERMADVLQQLLGGTSRVRLVSLRNLPPAPIERKVGTAASARDESAIPVQVFRHGVEVVVEGSYPALIDYVDRLERQPWQLTWGKVVLRADHPRVTLTLTLYTLSLDRAWLAV
ncbi:MAG: type II secretion system protein M [Burkholderiales bacterium]|nr:type II secretion system protein M [Burkholderiales bacterium]